MQTLDQTFLHHFLSGLAVKEGTNAVLDTADYCYYYLTVVQEEVDRFYRRGKVVYQ